MTHMHAFEPDDERFWRRVRRVVRLPSTRRRRAAELDEEMRFHIEGRIEEIMAVERLDRADAEREARRRFGDIAHYRSQASHIDEATHRGRARMEIRDAVVRETRQSIRTLVRTPVFSLVTLITLALGIGAATAVFTLLDAVVLRPLSYPHADRLVSMASPVPKLKGQTRWGLGRHEIFYFGESTLGAVRIDDYKYRLIDQPGGWLGAKVQVDVPFLTNLRLDPFERAGWSVDQAASGSQEYFQWFKYEFWRFVFVQQQVEKLAMTAIEFPPMQKGASFNLEAVKEKIEAARAAMAK